MRCATCKRGESPNPTHRWMSTAGMRRRRRRRCPMSCWARLTPARVEREGISHESAVRAIAARQQGRRLKLVAQAARDGRRVIARVSLEELPSDDLLAGVDGQQNAIVLSTDLL